MSFYGRKILIKYNVKFKLQSRTQNKKKEIYILSNQGFISQYLITIFFAMV